MGAAFGPSRAIAVFLAAAMALVGISLVGTPASSEGAVPFQFSVAGDFGSWSGMRESLDQLNASGSDFAIALGDLSYGGNTGYANTTEEAWCAKFHKFFPKIEIIAGNHDTGDTIAGEGDINQFIAYCPFNLKTSVDGVYGKQYTFDFPRNNPLARFILISPDLIFRVDDGEHYSYDVGTPRYDWTKGQIEDAKAKGIPWVIVGFHKNCIGAGEHHCETGTDILNLLIQEKVDLILNAHEHNYERSHQLAFTDSCPQGIQEHVFIPGCIVHNGTDAKYQRGAGSVLVIQGTGGREIDTFNESDPTAGYFAAYMGVDTIGAANGVVTYNVYPDRIEERTSFNGTYADSFTIGEFTPGLFERVLQVLPIAAPIVVGLIGFGVGGFLVWRNRQATPSSRTAKPRLPRVRDFRM